MGFSRAHSCTQDNNNVSPTLMLWLQQFRGTTGIACLSLWHACVNLPVVTGSVFSACLFKGENTKVWRKLREHSGSWMLKCEKLLCSGLFPPVGLGGTVIHYSYGCTQGKMSPEEIWSEYLSGKFNFLTPRTHLLLCSLNRTASNWWGSSLCYLFHSCNCGTCIQIRGKKVRL